MILFQTREVRIVSHTTDGTLYFQQTTRCRDKKLPNTQDLDRIGSQIVSHGQCDFTKQKKPSIDIINSSSDKCQSKSQYIDIHNKQNKILQSKVSICLTFSFTLIGTHKSQSNSNRPGNHHHRSSDYSELFQYCDMMHLSFLHRTFCREDTYRTYCDRETHIKMCGRKRVVHVVWF